MPDARHCPDCGAELPPDAPQGLCPQCLLRLGLQQPREPPPGLEDRRGADSSTRAAPGSPDRARFVAPAPAVLAGHFPQLEILELLGQGGMGAVYKVRQPRLNRLAALKILPPQAAGDPAFAERFAREAQTLARLNHPHIVAVYDFGEVAAAWPASREAGAAASSDPLYYFLMEYVDGANLRQLLHSGRLAPAEALAIVPQICDALQYAHDEGIVHRDIKPENILVDKKGRVKIADFGLAKLLGRQPAGISLTETHQVMGTLRYMAPEQMEGSREVDHRADIYSLGVVFYELLTGEVPLGRYEPPSKKVALDVRLDEVVLRTLEREPDRRYQHASEVKLDVESISRAAVPAPERRTPFAEADHVWEDARGQVRGPAIGLLVTGVLYCAFLIVLVLLTAGWWLLGLPASSAYETRQYVNEFEAAAQRAGFEDERVTRPAGEETPAAAED